MDASLAPEVRIAGRGRPPGTGGTTPSEEFLHRKAEGIARAEAGVEVLGDDVLENRERPEVRELIERLIMGTEPLPRPLKTNEVKCFEPQHINIIMLRAAGFRPGEIAAAMVVEKQLVSNTLHHPYGRKLLAALVPANMTKVYDIRTGMQEAAAEILEHMTDLALRSEELGEVRQVGFGLLDRIGHGPLQKTVSASVPASAFGGEGEGGGNPGVLGRLASAMEESNRIDKEVMPRFTSKAPPDEGGLPAGSEVGLGGGSGPGAVHEVESVVPSSPPTSEAAD